MHINDKIYLELYNSQGIINKPWMLIVFWDAVKQIEREPVTIIRETNKRIQKSLYLGFSSHFSIVSQGTIIF